MKKSFLILVVTFLVFLKGWAYNTDTLKVYSPEMEKDVPVIVVVPEEANASGKGYPVLYLLHGHSGNEESWLEIAPNMQDYADTYQMIVVMPDGGFDSWYVDSPVDEKVRYDSFMANTLVPTIDSQYHTEADKVYRGIAGLSMGGHGALYLAINHQDLFGAAASVSGGVDIRPFPDNWGIKKVLGDRETHKDNWEKAAVINKVDSLKKGTLQLFIDDGIDDIFIKENRALHQKLLDLGIDHDYIERPGAHTQEYWRKALPYHMVFFNEFFMAENEE